jgi:hypothetical protein
MIVAAALGIELRTTTLASGIAMHVLQYCELYTAGAAKDGFLAPFALRPYGDLMIGKQRVTVLAGIVDTATLHPDGNYVIGPAVVLASSLRVKICTTHLRND